MSIRRVAVFHCTARVGSAWCCAEGISLTLAAMGYQVMDCGHPGAGGPPVEALRGADFILLGAVEWYGEMLEQRYGAAWAALPMPKLAWYAESAHRDDRDFPFGRYRALADRHYFPAAQDAMEFGGTWLPFGADPVLFAPRPVPKRHDAAFLGSLYPKRVEYLRRIGLPLARMAPVADPDPVRSFARLAEAYCSTRIFVNLPAYSRLLVTKVTEVMACGTLLLTPAMDHPSGLANMAQFEDRRHLVYYPPDRPEVLEGLIAHYLARPQEREAIAAAGRAEILRAHSLEARLRRLLADAEALQG
ncbi:glycosyltransferase [Roseicella sp. DB1501]|uniref:glycosyltransferase family protein n=1 Tax=Roseicella sp. DB1501 TaxID=2730925 RepID=UPI00149272EA|nr:glycosyltransferase [Roseicella sp. DB1501]NOG72672.1 glycosyltransferase [Roseicella sp. DB1501]